MPIHFEWQPNNNPVKNKTMGRVPVGLMLYGDDKRIPGKVTDGRIKIYETPGKNDVVRERRILATFHGRFHRDLSKKENVRVTFEINLSGTKDPHNGCVQGFDPECIPFIGVDAFVFTFLNREFQINLPFFLDTEREGSQMEIQAFAEIGSAAQPVELAKSAILTMLIRRENEVTTTMTQGSNSARYKGKLVGNLILHPEEYLIQGAYRQRSGPWPQNIAAKVFEVPRSGPFKIDFRPYQDGDLRIVILDEVLSATMPDESTFPEEPAQINPNFSVSIPTILKPTPKKPTVQELRTRLSNLIRNSLTEIFADAGFQGTQVLWEGEQGTAQLIKEFKGAFSRWRSSDWGLNRQNKPLEIPFWTFYVAGKVDPDPLGFAETPVCDNYTNAKQTGQREYLLPCPVPIGSGNKRLTAPIRIYAAYFLDRFNDALTEYKDFQKSLDIMAHRMAVLIAHEVAHSLGLMHDVRVDKYSEKDAEPLLSIMCSAMEEGSFGWNGTFSNQAKLIWKTVFGSNVKPNFNPSYLRNKTWGNDLDKVDWSERNTRFFKANQEKGGTLNVLTSGSVPPYAKTGSAVQRGTYVSP